MGCDYTPEPYKAYKNRNFTKHHDKIKEALRQIRDLSLKPEDKVKLKKEMMELIQASL